MVKRKTDAPATTPAARKTTHAAQAATRRAAPVAELSIAVQACGLVAPRTPSVRTSKAAAKLATPKVAAPTTTAATTNKASVRQRFGELRAALAEGWVIVQPIFARPLWTVADDSTTAFNFVLRRERATRLLTIPEGRTVTRFIRDQQLTVDYRR